MDETSERKSLTAAPVCTCKPNEYCAADDCHGATEACVHGNVGLVCPECGSGPTRAFFENEEAAIALAMEAYPGTTEAVWDHMEENVKDAYRKAARG